MTTARIDGPSPECKIRVLKRDRFKCVYCGASGNDSELEIDHIIPVAKGGSHHISNLTTACRACNQKKGAGDLPRLPVDKTSTPYLGGGLVGMFLHIIADGEISIQGRVISVDGDVVLVQLYEWLMGEPTIVKPMGKADLYSPRCILYSDAELWRTAAARNSAIMERKSQFRAVSPT